MYGKDKNKASSGSLVVLIVMASVFAAILIFMFSLPVLKDNSLAKAFESESMTYSMTNYLNVDGKTDLEELFEKEDSLKGVKIRNYGTFARVAKDDEEGYYGRYYLVKSKKSKLYDYIKEQLGGEPYLLVTKGNYIFLLPGQTEVPDSFDRVLKKLLGKKKIEDMSLVTEQ